MEKQELLGVTADTLPVWVIPIGAEATLPAFSLLNQLREAGIASDMDHGGRSLKAQMKQANRVGARYVLMLGEEEVKTNQVTLKNMATGDQTLLSATDAVNQLKQEMNG